MPSNTRILVIFSSIFGANAALAKRAEGILHSLGADVRVRGIPQVVLAQYESELAKTAPKASRDDLEWADGFVFLSPVHSGTYAASVKAFVDNHHDDALSGAFLNKTFTAMVTAELEHSGQEAAAIGLNEIAAIWGCLAVTPSTAQNDLNLLDGNAFGLSFTLRKGKLPEGIDEVLHAHLSRFCDVTQKLVRSAKEAPAPANNDTGPQRLPQTFVENVR